MIAHIVLPLSRRMIETFPLMRQGRICYNNVMKLIHIYDRANSIDKAIDTFNIETKKMFDDNDRLDNFLVDPHQEDEHSPLAFHSAIGGGIDLTKPKKWSTRIQELYEWKEWGNVQEGLRRLPWNRHEYTLLKTRIEELEINTK